MTLQVGRSEDTAATMSNINDEDVDSFTDLLRFIDVASRHVRQALNRPRRSSSRRRVNHRNYLARILSDARVDAARPTDGRSQTASMSRPDNQPNRRPSRGTRRCSKAKTMQSVMGERSKSFAVVSRQNSDHHINANGLTMLDELDSSAAVGGHEGSMMTQSRRPPVSSSLYFNSGVSQAQEHPVHPLTVNDEQHHSTSFFRHPAACLPQQSQQLSLEHASANSWYPRLARRPYPCFSGAGMWPPVHSACDCSSLVGEQSSERASRCSDYQQGPPAPSSCDVTESFNLSTSSWSYDLNRNELSAGSSYWTASSVISPFATYNSREYVFNHDVASLQHQQPATSDFGLPCNAQSAASFFPAAGADGHRDPNDWTAVRGTNDGSDTSPSSFNDSGLGSTSFWSAAPSDADGSGSTDSSSFYWPSDYAFSPSIRPTETLIYD